MLKKFNCLQTGHLAKACPDNPRGLYPKGGGCRFVLLTVYFLKMLPSWTNHFEMNKPGSNRIKKIFSVLLSTLAVSASSGFTAAGLNM